MAKATEPERRRSAKGYDPLISPLRIGLWDGWVFRESVRTRNYPTNEPSNALEHSEGRRTRWIVLQDRREALTMGNGDYREIYLSTCQAVQIDESSQVGERMREIPRPLDAQGGRQRTSFSSLKCKNRISFRHRLLSEPKLLMAWES
jgi:hypothetical protein